MFFLVFFLYFMFFKGFYMEIVWKLAHGLKYFRDRMGFNQADLAEKLGVKQQNVSTWEAGKAYPSYSVIKKLLKLGAMVEELFGDNYTRRHFNELIKAVENGLQIKNDNAVQELFAIEYYSKKLLKETFGIEYPQNEAKVVEAEKNNKRISSIKEELMRYREQKFKIPSSVVINSLMKQQDEKVMIEVEKGSIEERVAEWENLYGNKLAKQSEKENVYAEMSKAFSLGVLMCDFADRFVFFQVIFQVHDPQTISMLTDLEERKGITGMVPYLDEFFKTLSDDKLFEWIKKYPQEKRDFMRKLEKKVDSLIKERTIEEQKKYIEYVTGNPKIIDEIPNEDARKNFVILNNYYNPIISEKAPKIKEFIQNSEIKYGLSWIFYIIIDSSPKSLEELLECPLSEQEEFLKEIEEDVLEASKDFDTYMKNAPKRSEAQERAKRKAPEKFINRDTWVPFPNIHFKRK
jgi:transcriptional regulator with XRE-family HTH domain